MPHRTSASHPLQVAAVAAGRGAIGITLCPGKHGDSWTGPPWARDMELDLGVIVAWGATTVVTLIEAHEFELLRVEALPDAIRTAGMEWLHFPIVDCGAPEATDDETWDALSAALCAKLRNGDRILVHCRGGLGRAGLVAAALLVEIEGLDAHRAIAAVRAVRPGAIETLPQENWVFRRSAQLKSRMNGAGDVATPSPTGALARE